jgi:hypothetical protein
MVMPAEPQVVEEVQIDSEEVDPDVDVGLPTIPEETETEVDTATEVAPPETVEEPSSVLENTTAPQQPPSAPPVDQQAINELHERRAQDVQRQWQDSVGKQAQSYKQRLEEAGYMPEQARDQARRYVQQEQKFRKQEQEAAEMVGFIEGRQRAAIHFMEKHGLANKQMISDFIALQQTETPVAMEKEAKRMKDDRALRAENARLKQGTVPPQTFDNSQGAAEATSNDARLLQAYIDGDRSEAATSAVKRKMSGS